MKFLIIICAILSSKKDEFKFTASLCLWRNGFQMFFVKFAKMGVER